MSYSRLTYTDGFKLNIYKNKYVPNSFLLISKDDSVLDINIYNILVSIHYKIITSLEFKIEYQSNNCGPNSREICIGIPTYPTRGILLIYEWKTKIYQDVYKDIFGSDSIGMSYHALAYFLINDYHIAIDTTSSKDKIQFYISNDKNDFIDIIKARYQCKQFNVYSDYKNPDLLAPAYKKLDETVILSSNNCTETDIIPTSSSLF